MTTTRHNRKLFIWDFHGTLEQGNEYAVRAMTNIILQRHGYAERLSGAQCRTLYGKKWSDYFAALLPDEPPAVHAALQAACFAFSAEHPEIITGHIRPAPYARVVLETIQQRKHEQVLVSNTKPESLAVFIHAVGLDHIFPPHKAFAADAHINNRTKYDTIRPFLAAHRFSATVTIGDSAGDVALGKMIGAITYLYAPSSDAFKPAENPDYRITDLRAVLDSI